MSTGLRYSSGRGYRNRIACRKVLAAYWDSPVSARRDSSSSATHVEKLREKELPAQRAPGQPTFEIHHMFNGL